MSNCLMYVVTCLESLLFCCLVFGVILIGVVLLFPALTGVHVADSEEEDVTTGVKDISAVVSTSRFVGSL